MQISVLISLLTLSAKIDRISITFSSISLLLAIFVMWQLQNNLLLIGLSSMTVILGLFEKYYALRVEFDRALFTSLLTNTENELTSALRLMDKSLCHCGLIAPNYTPDRPLVDRLKGSAKLLKKQGFLTVIQSVILIGNFIVLAYWFN